MSPDSALTSVLDVLADRHGTEVRRFSDRDHRFAGLERTPCDVLIVDLREPVRMLEVLSQAKRLWPWQTRIAIVRRGAVSQAVEATQAGVSECLERPVQQDCLVSAVERGLRRTAALFDSDVALTPVEATIAHLILTGKTSRDIAVQLQRSRRTIDVHRRRIRCKLGVCGLIGLAKWAIERDLFDLRADGRRK